MGYGLGVGISGRGAGRTLSHFGNWAHSATTPHEGGAFFGHWENGVTVVVTYDKRIDDAQQRALQDAVQRSVAP